MKRFPGALGPFSLLAITGLILVNLSACNAPQGHAEIQRAEQWMELGETERARAELASVIQEFPRNIPARYLIARSYVLDAQTSRHSPFENITRALTFIDQAERIEQGNSRIAAVRGDAYRILNGYLQSHDAGTVQRALSVAEEFPAPEALDGVFGAMAHADDRVADRATMLGMSLDPPAARSRLIELMEYPAFAVRNRAALRMWERERYEPARGPVRAVYLNAMTESGSLQRAREMAAALADTGYQDVEASLVGYLLSNLESDRQSFGMIAAFEVISRNSRDTASSIGHNYFENANRDNTSRLMCSNFGRTIVNHLGGYRNIGNATLLRGLIGNLILANGQHTECRNAVLEAVSVADGANWRGIISYYHSGGWSIFNGMIPGRISEMRSGSPMRSRATYASSRWNLFAENATAAENYVGAVVATLGTYNPFSGGREVLFSARDLTFFTPTRCQLVINIANPNDRHDSVGEIVVVLESTGHNAEQPWEITEVISAQLDGRSLAP